MRFPLVYLLPTLLCLLGADAGAVSGRSAVLTAPLAEVANGPAADPPADSDGSPIKRITTVDHLGRPHFRIRTRSATYLYDPVAGGFSSILDKLGNDWVAYRDDAVSGYPGGAATKYRGLPNLVFGGEEDGAGHPGFAKCESRVTRRNQITTVSASGRWEWRWTFYRDAARLDVVRTPDDRKYWFLYEGPAGGQYRPRSTFWATDLHEPSYVIHDHFRGDVYRAPHRYFFFGENNASHVFFMLQLTPDVHADHVSYLGAEEIGAADSNDGMVVAGFGRAEGATPLLSGPNSFLIGFVPHLAQDPLATGRTRRRIEKIARSRRPRR